ncbi:Retrovirus-related Pol polyprotein from transposon 17.6, partial [Mucuna pruriens]
MDDFTVYAKSFDTCLENLSQVLRRCMDTNLVLNFEKCHFMVAEGIVLGHLVSSRGIEVNKAKVDIIASLPNPTSMRFIKNICKIALPLSKLLQKDVDFDFDQPYVEAVQELKKRLTSMIRRRSPLRASQSKRSCPNQTISFLDQTSSSELGSRRLSMVIARYSQSTLSKTESSPTLSRLFGSEFALSRDRIRLILVDIKPAFYTLGVFCVNFDFHIKHNRTHCVLERFDLGLCYAINMAKNPSCQIGVVARDTSSSMSLCAKFEFKLNPESSFDTLHDLDLDIEITLHRLRKVRNIVVSSSSSFNSTSNSDNSIFATNNSDSFEYSSANISSDSNFGPNKSQELEQMENNDQTLKELATLDVVYQPWCIQRRSPQALKGISCGLFHNEAIGDIEGLYQDEGVSIFLGWSCEGLVVSAANAFQHLGDMKCMFLEKLFSASRTVTIRKEICGIRQHFGETLHEYWEI